MIEFIGWIAGVMFAVCAFPQAYVSFKDGHSDHISALTLWLWGLGEILTIIYILAKHGFDGPLMLNYFMNLVSVSFIMYYKYFPRRKSYASNKQ